MIEKLRLKIEKETKITFSEYMELVLFDREYGVYENNELFGEDGFFITSPLVSKYFSQCIAKNYINIIKSVELDSIVELGPGNAALAIELLFYLKDKGCLPKKYYFYERSILLTKKQKRIMERAGLEKNVEFIWIDNFENFPKESFIIANELFDCIPTDLIKYKNNTFMKGYVDKSYRIIWEDYDFLSDSISSLLALPFDIPNNYIFEFSKEQYNIINSLDKFVNKAYLIIFDYGYSANELYIPDRMNGTVSCIRNHLSDFNPLTEIGDKDISSFVNFSYINNILAKV